METTILWVVSKCVRVQKHQLSPSVEVQKINNQHNTSSDQTDSIWIYTPKV